jgi:retron-type reverse transcriptase
VISPDLYSFRELWRHYRRCRHNKRNTINALAFEVNAEANLLALQRELRAHAYRPGRSICFVTDGPKPREVFAADFRDRVVHHLLVSHQERLFEPMFIHDSYACRKDRGTLAASDRLTEFLRRVTSNGRRTAWALKLDVASFFPSIDKDVLFALLARCVRHPELRWLARAVLFHDPTADYQFHWRGSFVHPPGSSRYPVPAQKSLFGKQNERGLPIGNLTSQFWANVYLNEVDQFVKRRLRCRHYLRYVDDMILLSRDREDLARWRAEIAEFLRTRLKLELRADWSEPFLVGRGIDFVGWKTWWNRRLPRRRTLGNLRARLDRFERAAVRPLWGGLARYIDLRSGCGATLRARASGDEAPSVAHLHATVASYAGHLRHGAAVRDWAHVWDHYPWLALLFEREGWTVHQRWPPGPIARPRRFQQQYGELVRPARQDCLVFSRVGRFIEFYGPQRLIAERCLGLRRCYAPRAGYAFTAGFLARLAGVYRSRAVRAGLAVVDVEQVDSIVPRGCKPRLPVGVVMPSVRPTGCATQTHPAVSWLNARRVRP